MKDKFEKWLEDNLLEEDHFSERRPRPKIVKMMKLDKILAKYKELRK